MTASIALAFFVAGYLVGFARGLRAERIAGRLELPKDRR